MNNKAGRSQELKIVVDASSRAHPTIGQCDACSPVISTPELGSNSFQPGVRYCKNPKILQCPIPLSGYHALLGPGQPALALVNDRTLDLLDDFEKPASFETVSKKWGGTLDRDSLQSTLERFLSLSLLVPMDCTEHQYVEVSHTLAVWLHVTERCNLRCVYCYLPHSQEDMPARVGIAGIEAAFRSALSHGYQRVRLKYAGGEPLLVLPAVIRMHQHALELGRSHQVEVDGVVLSNGTLLTAQAVASLKEMDLRLSISLDGLGSAQDEHRPYADGDGSAADVLQGVELAMAMELNPSISITVSSRSVGGLPDLLGWILDHDLSFGLNFYRESDLVADTSGLRLDEELVVEGLLRAYEVIESHVSQHSRWSSLADRLDLSGAHLRGCSAGHSYLVFSPSGRLSKCQMDQEHTVGDINDADPLAIVRASPSGVISLPVDQISECRNCRWRYWCAGGCPLMAYRATGRYDSKSPVCDIYKALFPEVVKLEGLRLLTHARGQNRAL